MRALSRAAFAAIAVAVALTMPTGLAMAVPDASGTSRTQATSGNPVTTVSKKTGLKVDGETITVSGTGFSTAEPGIYVGLVQDNMFSSTDASAWMTTEFIRPAQIIGGAWSTTVDVAAVLGSSNCSTNSCSIYTVAAHGSSDRSQDTKTAVTFAAAATTTTTTAPTTTTTAKATTTTAAPTTTAATTTKATTTTTAATTTATTTTAAAATTTTAAAATTTTTTRTPTSNGPRVSADRTSGLNPSGDTITISGSGFSTSGPGIYIGLAQSNRYSSSDASVFHDAKFIKPADMPGGSFTVSVGVTASFANSDCLVNACAIYTLAAHGSSDRSQDTSTPVGFTGASASADVDTSGTGGTSGTTAPTTTPGAGATTITSNSGLSVTLSKATNLTPAGESVTISGSGFSGADPGIYVGLVQDNVFNAMDASVWMNTAFIRPAEISGGNWSTTLELAAVVGSFDCLANTCSIYTVAAHGSSDRTQDSQTPVGFVGGVAPGTITAPPANIGAAGVGAASTVTVTLSKSSGLKDGDTITVTGAGFSSSGPGVYVGLIQDSKFSTTDASAWMTTAFLTPSKIKDGAWSTSVEVTSVKGDSDCTKNTCSIYTVAAHGSSDRSQDSKSPVTFGDDPAAAAMTEAELAAAGLNADGTPTSGGSNSAIRNLADAFTDGSAWIAPLLVGGVVGAGIAVGATYAMRRRAS